MNIAIDPDQMVPRQTQVAKAQAFFNLSQTQRRLAHRARREAAAAEAEGNRRWYLYYSFEATRLWREAKDHLRWAREEFYL